MNNTNNEIALAEAVRQLNEKETQVQDLTDQVNKLTLENRDLKKKIKPRSFVLSNQIEDKAKPFGLMNATERADLARTDPEAYNKAIMESPNNGRTYISEYERLTIEQPDKLAKIFNENNEEFERLVKEHEEKKRNEQLNKD